MAKQPLKSLTESMFYVLLALWRQERCGTEIAAYVRELTAGRVALGPGTLYGVLARMNREGLIAFTGEEGRRKNYAITETGRTALLAEYRRLKRLVADGALLEEGEP